MQLLRPLLIHADMARLRNHRQRVRRPSLLKRRLEVVSFATSGPLGYPHSFEVPLLRHQGPLILLPAGSPYLLCVDAIAPLVEEGVVVILIVRAEVELDPRHLVPVAFIHGKFALPLSPLLKKTVKCVLVGRRILELLPDVGEASLKVCWQPLTSKEAWIT